MINFDFKYEDIKDKITKQGTAWVSPAAISHLLQFNEKLTVTFSGVQCEVDKPTFVAIRESVIDFEAKRNALPDFKISVND